MVEEEEKEEGGSHNEAKDDSSSTFRAEIFYLFSVLKKFEGKKGKKLTSLKCCLLTEVHVSIERGCTKR